MIFQTILTFNSVETQEFVGDDDDGLWHDSSYFLSDDGLWHDAAYFAEDDGLWHDDIYF